MDSDSAATGIIYRPWISELFAWNYLDEPQEIPRPSLVLDTCPIDRRRPQGAIFSASFSGARILSF
jgi:hypothetical protein